MAAVPYLLPGLLLFGVFVLLPMVRGLQMSLYNWSIMPGGQSEFVGLANFKRAFGDPVVRVAVRNTLIYVAVTVPGQMMFGMLAALALNSAIRGKVLFRTLYYLPVVTSWVVVSLVFKYLFSSGPGIVNYVLKDLLHVVPEYVDWLQNTWTAMVPINLLGIWKGIGWTMVMFLAALQTIPKELYEAASIDGASRSQAFFRVTLPLIRPTLLFVAVMLMIGAFNVFLSVYMLTAGGPLNSTEVLLHYMYKQAFSYFDFGYGAALSLLFAVVVLVISLFQFKFIHGKVEY